MLSFLEGDCGRHLSRKRPISGELFVGSGKVAKVGYAIPDGFVQADFTAESAAKSLDDALTMDRPTIVFDNHGP
jgi:hypothetical protein